MSEKIIILDFGSQYTQLIGRALREQNVYCEIIPYNKNPEISTEVKGIILSGSPFSVNDEDALKLDLNSLGDVPVLGICYGAQLITKVFGGRVEKSDRREYGRSKLLIRKADNLFAGIADGSDVWMSHSDTIKELPENFRVTAETPNISVAAFEGSHAGKKIFGIQFHPEVYHTTEGKKILRNFIIDVCGCRADWTPAHFIRDSIHDIKEKVGNSKVIMALSGGVDSTVAATLIHRAIGDRLYGIFVDNGLLRKDEFSQVLDSYKNMGLNVKGVDAREHFYTLLAGHPDPEEKRKIIGKTFIEVFDKEAHELEDIEFLGQGTIYPDVIESVSVHGPSVTIK